MGNSRCTYFTTSPALRSIILLCFCLFTAFPGVCTQTPILSLDDFVNENNNCTVNTQNTVMVEGTLNLTGVTQEDWSNFVEFVIDDGNVSSASSTVLCQADLSNCSSQSQLDCYCKERNGSIYTVVFKQEADVQYSRKTVWTRFTDLNLTSVTTSGDTPYPYVSEIIQENLAFGSNSGLPPLSGAILNIPITDQEIHFTVNGLTEPYSISIMTHGMTINRTNQPTVSANVSESYSNVTLSYEEHASCQRKGSYFYPPKDVWRQEPQLSIGDFSNVGSCVRIGQDIGILEATFNHTGVDESSWFRILSIVIGNQTIPTCTAILDNCPPTGYQNMNCYCKERRGHVYTVIYNQSAILSYSEKEVKLRAFKLTQNSASSLIIESNESIQYPFVSEDLTVILTYDNKSEAQYPPVNNSVIDVPEDNQVLEFTAEGMRHPSSISYRLSSPDVARTVVNQSSVEITVFDNTNYITVSYQEELYCQRRATYEFTLKAATRLEPTLRVSSVTTEPICPSAGKRLVTIEGEVDFTEVNYADWILDVHFFTASNSSICSVPLEGDCEETAATRCYCRSRLKDVYTVVFNDTMDPTLSLQMINIRVSRKNSSTVEAVEAVEYPSDDVIGTMEYGNQTQSPPINNSMIFIPDEHQVIRFTVDGIRHPSSISYKLSSPNHGYKYVNQSSANITIYDSTNYITIWYEDFCQRSASYHFTLKDVERQDPKLTVGPITSSRECVLAEKSMVTFEAVVDFTGVDYSQWILILIYRTPAKLFMLCAASLVDCGKTSTLSCYCKGHVRDVYTLVFNSTAELAHSLQPIYLEAQRTNFSIMAADETPEYPFVNQDINVTMTYGNQTESPLINNSRIYVPNDTQVVQVTVNNMRHPSFISYKLSSSDQEWEFDNQSSINITVYDGTNHITVQYAEKEFCQRSASYIFTLKVVWREEPQIVPGASESVGTSCPVNGRHRITLESSLNFTGVDDSKWSNSMDFISSTSDDVICQASLTTCQPTSDQRCYCKDYEADTYSVVFNDIANSSLSESMIQVVAYRADISTVLRSATVEYPYISDNIMVTVKYASQPAQPLINNSVQEIDGDHSHNVNFTVDGLSAPYTLIYVTSDDPTNVMPFANENTVSIPIRETRVIITYKEVLRCKRMETYIYTMKEDDSSDGLSTPVIIAIVIGGLVLLLFLVAIIFAAFNKNCLCKSPKRKRGSISNRYVMESSTNL